MERKDFLRSSLGLVGISALLVEACKKTAVDSTVTAATESNLAAASCIVSPTEEVGPYPYPGGEITNPLNRSDVRETQTGILYLLTFTVVNAGNSCTPVQNARVDIWHCSKDGYYSGYANQPGYLGTKSYVGETFLRGYQTTDANGQVTFKTVYPGWYQGRATHIHYEVYINNVLKKAGQIAFDETVSNKVHTSKLYKAHGINTTTNAKDSVFGNSATDLANETAVSIQSGNKILGSYTIGISI